MVAILIRQALTKLHLSLTREVSKKLDDLEIIEKIRLGQILNALMCVHLGSAVGE